jgi:hypothetical protein
MYPYNDVTNSPYGNSINDNAVSNYTNNNNGGFSPLSPQFDVSGGNGIGNLGTPFSTDSLKLGLGAIQTLGSLWMGFKQNQLAKNALKLQNRAFETNLKNQTQSYNTALEDRIRARYNTENRNPSEADAYISANRL